MNERQIYIDWLRILLIFSVFLFHVGMVFNVWSWHIKNDVRVESLTPIMRFLHAWRLPLLFLLSGAGTRFAVGFRSKGQFAGERTRRLFLPLLFGIFLLVPVSIYIEKINQYSSLFNFYPHLFEGSYPQGNFSLHHLWFIVYLFFISMVFIPFIWFYRSRWYRKFEKVLETIASWRGGLLLLYIPLILSQLLLRPRFPAETHAFINDWAFMCLFFLYFLYGFVLLGNPIVVRYMVRDLRIWAGTTLIAIVIMQLGLLVYKDSQAGWIIYDNVSLFMSWSIGLFILSFFKRYLNHDHPLRRPLNEAIYPFYLLHYPVMIIVAFFVIKLSFPVWPKAMLIISVSLICIWTIYRLLIRPFNIIRFIFGMKKKEKGNQCRILPSFAWVRNFRN
jgi:glucan biosynthesis protein C